MNKTLRIGYIVFLIASLIGIGCSSILPGNDPLVVRAEQSLKGADVTFNTFVSVEYVNRAQLLAINPQIEKLADKVRVGWTNWAQKLDSALLAYKHSKTPENAAALTTAQAVVDTNLTQSQAALAQAVSAVATNLPVLTPIGH
jgi:hypothetical protein